MYEDIKARFEHITDDKEKRRLIKNAINSVWKKNNKDKVNSSRKRFRKRYPEKVKQQNDEFRKNNPNYKKEYYQQNKAKAQEYWKNRTSEQKKKKAEYNKKWKNTQYKNNIKYRLGRIMSTALKRSIQTNRSDYIKKLLGYTVEDLKQHLEAQFEDWMSWDNLGLTASKPKQTWQIDHIIPLNTFNITSVDSEEFRKCWALENLRPLDSYTNTRRPKNGSDIQKAENNEKN